MIPQELFHPQELRAMVVGNENYDFHEMEKVRLFFYLFLCIIDSPVLIPLYIQYLVYNGTCIEFKYLAYYDSVENVGNER